MTAARRAPRPGATARRASPVDARLRARAGRPAAGVGGRCGRGRGADRGAAARPAARATSDRADGDRPCPGRRWIEPPRRGDEPGAGGEYVYLWHDRWRVGAGDIADAIESPFAGIVREVRPGIGITIRAAGRGIRGIVALGGPTRGRLQAGAEGELRSGGLDVGSAGTILVVGSRVDAETLTRARAMGVRGDRRRGPVEQGAARLPRLGGAPAGGPPPAAAVRGPRPRRGRPASARGRRPGRPRGARRVARSRSSTTRRCSSSTCRTWSSRDPPDDLVRIRSGPLAGREGRLVEAIGPRRFAGRGPSRGGPRPAARRHDRRGPARRPRAVRLSVRRPAAPSGGAATGGPSRLRLRSGRCQPHRPRTPARRARIRPRRPRSAARLAGARPGRRRPLPVGRPRRRQDPARQGVRRRARRDGHDHLAELRPDGRVRRAAAALPRRPVPARRRGRRARRRPHRRPPGRRRHDRRVARSARAPRCRRAGSTSVIDGTGDEPRTITLRAGEPSLRRYLEAVP